MCPTERASTRAPAQIIEPLVSEQWFVRMETLAAPGADERLPHAPPIMWVLEANDHVLPAPASAQRWML